MLFDGFRRGHLITGGGSDWIYPDLGSDISSIEKDFPTIAKVLLHPYERTYDGVTVIKWSRKYWWLAHVVSVGYLIAIYAGKKFMRNRAPFNLKTPLKYWNLFLAVFSLIGASRVVPNLILLLTTHGSSAAMCSPPIFVYGTRSCGLWTMLFVYSKFFELIDTAFIILRKKHLTFLHWYHHCTVLSYTFDAFVVEQPLGIFFAAMNYAVHAVMYFYYYLAEARGKPPSWGTTVTVLQILQMVIGVYLTGVAIFMSQNFSFLKEATTEIAMDPIGTRQQCYMTKINLYAATAMYSTYFILFARFFFRRYVLSKGGKKGHKNINTTGGGDERKSAKKVN